MNLPRNSVAYWICMKRPVNWSSRAKKCAHQWIQEDCHRKIAATLGHGQEVDDEVDPLSEDLETTSMLRLPPAYIPPCHPAPFQAVVFGSDLVRACPLKTIQARSLASLSPHASTLKLGFETECRKHWFAHPETSSGLDRIEPWVPPACQARFCQPKFPRLTSASSSRQKGRLQLSQSQLRSRGPSWHQLESQAALQVRIPHIWHAQLHTAEVPI